MRSLRVHHLSGPKWHQGKETEPRGGEDDCGEGRRATPANVSGRDRVSVAGLGTTVPPRAKSHSIHHRRYGRSAMRLGWHTYAVPST